jgi:uncharacterized protein YyaL (SSP411 family)
VPELIGEAAERLLELEDPEHGGLGSAPKFPNWPVLRFLMARGTSDPRARDAWQRWLHAMLRGGVYDHVGGGIFRYATDEAWTVPHFEKMLYDNAQLLSALAEAFRLAPAEEYAREARRTAEWMLLSLARPAGGFWSSLDAESGNVEGGAYLWTLEELRQALTAEEVALVARRLGVDPQASPTRQQVLTRRGGRAEEAAEVDAVLEKLASARSSREQPRAIENAPTEWNGLAARGLLEVGDALGDERLTAAGREVLDAVLREVDAAGGSVPHLLGVPAAAGPRLLADYAALAAAALAAGEAYRERAVWLVGQALERFEDDGVLYMTERDTDLPVRPVAYDDQPAPSGIATLLEVYRELRPQDAVGFTRLLEPALGFAAHAPHLAGATLSLAARAVFSAGEATP